MSESDRRRRIASGVAEAVALLAVPTVLAVCAATGAGQSALLSLVVAVASLALFFAGYEGSRPRLRDTMPVAVLAALAAAGRILFAPVPDFKPVSAVAIVAGAAFGRRSGFLVGALAALVSNFFFGQGPWTPWQMYAWGLVGYLGGVLARTGAFEHRIPLLGYGLLSGILYGLLVNIWSIVGFYHPETFEQGLLVYAFALPFDVVHGIATVVFLAVIYRPWMRKLERVKRKYGILEAQDPPAAPHASAPRVEYAAPDAPSPRGLPPSACEPSAGAPHAPRPGDPQQRVRVDTAKMPD